MQIKIGKRDVGDGQPCFIIAEAGVNHNGDIENAKKLIDIAKDSKADAVKFQTWITEEIVTRTVKQAEYQAKNIGKKESQYEMLKKLELSFNEFEELNNYADKKGILFLSTPDDEKSVDFLDSIGVPAFKIGSGELTNVLLLEKVANKDKPIIFSTGMANLAEIEDAIHRFYKSGNKNIILLHCTSQYPTKHEHVNLNAMITLKEKFNLLVGYSDHTIGTLVPLLAVCLGACVIEKHFTYDKNAKGPDHICSLDPLELKEMVEKIRTTELILGNYIKAPTKNELKIKDLVRKTVVAKIDIPKGIKITKNMLTVKRSNGTLKPKEIIDIIGKISLKNKKKDQPINYTDFK